MPRFSDYDREFLIYIAPYLYMMCNNPDLSEIERQVKLLQEMLGNARITSLDFDNREHST